MADATVELSGPAPLDQEAPATVSVIESLHIPVYRVLWAGTVLAFLSFNSWSPATGVVAFDLAGNNQAVGIVVFGQGLAMLLLNPFSGAIADRLSKKRLMLFWQVIAFTTMLSVGLLIKGDLISIPLLTIGSFMVGCMFAFNGPTRNAMVGEIIPNHSLGNAIALLQVGANFARTFAPFLAGALLTWKPVGPAGTYFVMAGILVVVIAIYLHLPDTPVRADRNQTSILQDVMLGVRHVRQKPRVLQSIVAFYCVAILGFAYQVLVPGYAKNVMGAGDAGVGILLGSVAAGGILTSLVAASASNSRHVYKLLYGSCLLLALALVLCSIAPNFAISIVTMALVGGGSSAFQTLNNVVALKHAEREFYGRVMGFMFLAFGVTNLFGLPIGILADVLGEREIFAIAGLLLGIATIGLIFWSRRLGEQERQMVITVV